MRQKFADNVENISNSISKGRPQMPRCVCVWMYIWMGVCVGEAGKYVNLVWILNDLGIEEMAKSII